MKTVSTTKIPRVQEMLVMGSLLSNEADTMSAMGHRMNKAMSAMRAQMQFYKNLNESHSWTLTSCPLEHGDGRLVPYNFSSCQLCVCVYWWLSACLKRVGTGDEG